MLTPEHVCTWLEGSHLRQRLNPTQRLLFDWTTCLPPQPQRLQKAAAAAAVRAFRQTHLNRFLFDQQAEPLSHTCAQFLDLLGTFEALKKQTKKDYTTLFSHVATLCDTTWSATAWKWHGWRQDVTRSAVVYRTWHADDVAACRVAHSLNTRTCATCGQKYKWTGHVGPECPATLKPYCCRTSDVAEAYLTACKPFSLQIHPDVRNILDTYAEALADWTRLDAEKRTTETLLDEVYIRRRPESAKLLNELQQTSRCLNAELQESKRDAAMARDMYNECAETLRRVRDEQRRLEGVLTQYKEALHNRDAQIHQMSLSRWQQQYVSNTPVAPRPPQYMHPSRQAQFC